ncbi:UDP-3-O-[3-hydroxymyristoyl] N-acetylglucosamine deacetylase [Candidatus Marinamargulisbacteria bacterium SCGC AG-333-B06]|nr:UDP-3-O-[3-hydroxymyristoyl] N-acetylglucosamine deacetylase [Candidatus Marinamargulisbacteria bacterium SCGC AG-333-B06]
MNHQTLSRSITIKGIGIHSGKSITMTCHPSNNKVIKITNIKEKTPSLTLSLNTLAKTHTRATQFQNSTSSITTTEHFLSACAAFGITSLDIEINGNEIPILDGSAKDFCIAFQQASICIVEASPLSPIIIKEPITVWEGNACIIATPAPSTLFSYYLSYDHPVIQSQSHTLELTKENYIKDIAAARTYGFEKEVKALIKQGLAKGGSFDNALVIGETKYLNPPRFKNECARHKLLDLIGDCWVLNRPIIGHIIGIKSGHQLNHTFTKTIDKIKI